MKCISLSHDSKPSPNFLFPLNHHSKGLADANSHSISRKEVVYSSIASQTFDSTHSLKELVIVPPLLSSTDSSCNTETNQGINQLRETEI